MNASLIDVELAQQRLGSEAGAAALSPVPTPTPAPLRPAPVANTGVALVPHANAIDRIRHLGTLGLAELRYRLRRLGSATLLGIAAAATAAILFVTSNLPQNAAVTALHQQLLQQSGPARTRAEAAPAGLTPAALPARGEAPNVVAKILEEAQAAGVDLPRGQYEYVPARDGVAAHYRMTFPVRGSYPKIRAFMDRTLVALPAVAVEGLRIERKNVGDDSVLAELKLAAYVRSDP